MILSAALIVRNEASEIRGVLETLRGFDEIVVVDTGSVDNTIEIIHEMALPAVRVLKHPWRDDFSEARNFAARNCTGAWILHIDADMRLLTDPIVIRQELHRIIDRTAAVTQIGPNGQRNRRTLLHRPGVEWVGAIHEALRQEGPLLPIEIQYGWSDSHHHDPDRNLRILQRGLDQNPQDARLAYYMGAELWDRGRPEEAYGWFCRCLENCSFRSERGDAYLYMAKIKWRLNQGEEARQHCLDSLLMVPDCREALLLMAEMSWEQEAHIWKTFAEVAQNRNVLFARA